MLDTLRFPIRFSKANRSLAIVGLRQENSWIEIGPDELTVQMGWAFHLVAPRSSVAGARADDERVLGWGVHGWRGEWLVNGSSAGMVRISFEPPAGARSSGFPVRVHTLRVSVADPVGLIATLDTST